jgi:class 3 adenylate cyclase
MASLDAGLRLVTLLTTDAVSSTELQLRVGDHRSDLLRRERDGLVTREVESNRGLVVKSTGDGIFSAFQGPSEALTCAVAIQRAMARRNLAAHERIDLRIGLATGEVIVEDDDIFGQASILCTRITDRAAPGEVLCDETTRSLASARGDWQVEAVGAVPLKGFDRGTPLFRVEWDEVFEPLVSVPSPLARSGAPFVGRPSVLATANQLWGATVSAQRPHLLVLGGEPGVGKTTLLAHLAETVNRSGATVLYGRCTDDDIDALRPIRQALMQYIAARPGHLDEELGAARRELVRLVPELEALVGPPRQREADHRATSAALLDAVAQWLRAASTVRPILFVIDDAERLDAQTAKLLRRLSEESGLGPLLFAIAHRDRDPAASADELNALVASLRSTDTTVEPLRLGPLGVDDVAALVARVQPAAGPQAADLHRDSGGNPLYLLELLRSSGPEGAGARYSPDGARGLVLRRVDQLPAGHVELLEAAAVLGQEFDVAAIEPMLGWPADEAYKALDALVRGELLREVSSSGTRFEFAHGLVRSAIYDRLTGPRRVATHLRAADTLEALAGGGRTVAARDIAHHHLRAAGSRSLEPALDWCRQAADDANGRLAYEEAGRWLDAGLELFGALHLRPNAEVLDLQLARAIASQRSGERGTRRRFLHAADTARGLGDAAGLRRVALAFDRGFFALLGQSDGERIQLLREALDLSSDEPGERACLLAQLASELTWDDPEGNRFQLADEALDLARTVDDRATLVRVLSLRPPTIWSPETFDDVREAVDELGALNRDLRDPVVEGRYLSFRFGTACEQGETQRLPNVVDRLGQLGWFLRLPDALWHNMLLRANVALLNGDLVEAQAKAQESLEWGRRARAPEALMFWAAVELEARRVGGGLDEMGEQLATARGSARMGGWSATRYLYDAGQASAAREDYNAAVGRGAWRPPKVLNGGPAIANIAYLAARFEDRPQAEHLLAVLEPYEGRFFQGITTYHVTEHYRGMLAATCGRLDQAAGLLRRAVDRQDEVGAPLLAAESRLEWARLALLGGPEGQAGAEGPDPRGLVDAALATFESCGARALAVRATEVRARL